MAKKSMHRDLKIGIGMMDGQKFLSHFNNVIHFLHDFPLKRLLQRFTFLHFSTRKFISERSI